MVVKNEKLDEMVMISMISIILRPSKCNVVRLTVLVYNIPLSFSELQRGYDERYSLYNRSLF